MHTTPQPSARPAPTAIMGLHGISHDARGRPAEARNAKHPAASSRMAADAPDQECPIDLSDPYIVSALRALHDSGLDVADAAHAVPCPVQPPHPSAGAMPTPATGVQLKRRPASPVVGLGAAGQAAARAPMPEHSESLGHVQAATSFSGFSAHPPPRYADGAAPYWPMFAQQGHPVHRQRALPQQAWPHLQPMYFPAPVFTPPRPPGGALLRSSGDSSNAIQGLGNVPQPSHAEQQARGRVCASSARSHVHCTPGCSTSSAAGATGPARAGACNAEQNRSSGSGVECMGCAAQALSWEVWALRGPQRMSLR